MSDLDDYFNDSLIPKQYPDCCGDCHHLDSDYSEYQDKTFYFCRKNVFFPTKKQTCKKQKITK